MRRELADVGPGAECPPGTGDDEKADGRVGHRRIDETWQRLPHGEVDRVALGRPSEGQRGAWSGDGQVEHGLVWAIVGGHARRLDQQEFTRGRWATTPSFPTTEKGAPPGGAPTGPVARPGGRRPG